MKTKEYMRETTMSERDRLWEEIEEAVGPKGTKEIEKFLSRMNAKNVDDTDVFRERATTFKGSFMPGSTWWEEMFETYYYDLEYCYFADRWLAQEGTEGGEHGLRDDKR
jgi:hypothetical protein